MTNAKLWLVNEVFLKGGGLQLSYWVDAEKSGKGVEGVNLYV